MIDWLREPENWVRVAWCVLAYAVLGQVVSHPFILITDPPENSAVFHLLLALSWQSLQFAAIGIIVTTHVRKRQEEDE